MEQLPGEQQHLEDEWCVQAIQLSLPVALPAQWKWKCPSWGIHYQAGPHLRSPMIANMFLNPAGFPIKSTGAKDWDVSDLGLSKKKFNYNFAHVGCRLRLDVHISVQGEWAQCVLSCRKLPDRGWYLYSFFFSFFYSLCDFSTLEQRVRQAALHHVAVEQRNFTPSSTLRWCCQQTGSKSLWDAAT